MRAAPRRAAKCPVCHVPPGEMCKRDDGTPLPDVHYARRRMSVRALNQAQTEPKDPAA